jgi:hypothetical protein
MQVPHVLGLPLAKLAICLHEQMSQFVEVRNVKEFRASSKVTPPMLNHFTYGQSHQMIGGVNVATLIWIQLTRPLRD